jgi:DNA-binding response OmpR family regulator
MTTTLAIWWRDVRAPIPTEVGTMKGCATAALSDRLPSIDHLTQHVYWQGVKVGLTMGEYRMVSKLVHANGQLMSYRALYDAVRQRPNFFAGDGEKGMRGNVRTMIKRARRKFEKIDPSFDLIQNYSAFGYAWRQE